MTFRFKILEEFPCLMSAMIKKKSGFSSVSVFNRIPEDGYLKKKEKENAAEMKQEVKLNMRGSTLLHTLHLAEPTAISEL